MLADLSKVGRDGDGNRVLALGTGTAMPRQHQDVVPGLPGRPSPADLPEAGVVSQGAPLDLPHPASSGPPALS